MNSKKVLFYVPLLTSTLLVSDRVAPLFAAPQKTQQNAQQSTQAVVPTLQAFKVVAKAGGEELVVAERARPGEVIEYQVQYANRSERGVKNLQATLPIPAGMAFVGGSASPMGVVASTDGRNFASLPLRRTIKTASGALKIVLVPFVEYRSLRWSFDVLGAGQSLKVSARARILGNAVAGSVNATSVKGVAR